MKTILILKDSSGKEFFKQEFPDRPSADKWLAEERRQKYWDKNNTWEFVDIPETKPSPEQQEAAKQKGASQDAARARLQSYISILEAEKNLSPEIKNLLNDLITVSL